MKIKLISGFLFLLLSLSTYAQVSGSSSSSLSEVAESKNLSFVKVKVVVYKKDTLAKILKRFVRDNSIISRKEAMVDKTLKSNPNIKNWRKLKTGETMYVYLDPKFIDMEKMKAFRKSVKKVSKKIKTKIKRKKSKVAIKKWSTFYMASIGQFSQQNDSLAKVEFKQNSTLTLGLMYTLYPKDGKYTILTSAYFSYLLAATSNLGTENIDVPIEVGFNIYYQYPFSKASYNLYGGLDYEKFNTFNLASVENDESLDFDENQIGFLTLGFSKAFKIKTRPFLFKGSFSQSAYSSRTVGYSDDTDTSTYTGSKFMAFLLSKINDQYFMSTLLKYHVLAGPSDVNVMRIGMGFGYLF